MLERVKPARRSACPLWKITMNACTTGKRYALCPGIPSVRLAMDGCSAIFETLVWSLTGLTLVYRLSER
jgi:hypothetical protein